MDWMLVVLWRSYEWWQVNTVGSCGQSHAMSSNGNNGAGNDT